MIGLIRKMIRRSEDSATAGGKDLPRGLFVLAVLECGAQLLKVDELAERDLTLFGPAERAKLVCAGELFLSASGSVLTVVGVPL